MRLPFTSNTAAKQSLYKHRFSGHTKNSYKAKLYWPVKISLQRTASGPGSFNFINNERAQALFMFQLFLFQEILYW